MTNTVSFTSSSSSDSSSNDQSKFTLGFTKKFLEKFNEETQEKLQLFERIAANSPTIEEFCKVRDAAMKFISEKALLKTRFQENDKEIQKEFQIFEHAVLHSSLENIKNRHSEINWNILKLVHQGARSMFFVHICQKGRLQLLRYIQETVGYDLVNNFFSYSSSSSIALFENALLKGKHWHIWLYIKRNFTLKAYKKAMHAKFPFEECEVYAEMLQCMDDIKDGISLDELIEAYAATVDIDAAE
jgi:hypothetical protein